METLLQVHENFVRNKTAEELQYALEQHEISLLSLETELNFYEFLLDSCKFKSPVMNLFERLMQFKKDIATSNKKRALLLNKINVLAIKIANAPFKKYDIIIYDLEEIEVEIQDFKTDIAHLKSSLFEYLQSVIIS
ncbi:hypothetical protein [Algibacter sp. R77976]|uniref:hypothetical protein n=1 Tax=Algibacter sp. R77976 TaxID=3093873 RepID=UPI0037CB0E0E